DRQFARDIPGIDVILTGHTHDALPDAVQVGNTFLIASGSHGKFVSRVEARLMDDVSLPDILQALFPCGSITGAPKLRAMEVIEELETAPREVYCGSIGWFSPDGQAEFNVAIRTLMVDGDQATLNVGGGIVWDSTPASEYEEALWKARFAQIDPKTSS
ncbi:chorismate-binding protein, partial [Marivivens sp.]|uniref:chorismate-binding protein n=1 Tax=Marivivens sp. TaxID=1978374 RepID=UPI0025BC4E36